MPIRCSLLAYSQKRLWAGLMSVAPLVMAANSISSPTIVSAARATSLHQNSTESGQYQVKPTGCRLHKTQGSQTRRAGYVREVVGPELRPLIGYAGGLDRHLPERDACQTIR